jgi:hypothetical protein
MKTQLLLICICAATLYSACAETWEPRTHDCSLQFPDGMWTFQKGGEINHGQVILTAVNREQTKAVNVLRYQVASSFSVQDPRFVQGLKEGFTKTGSRFVSDGYTNVNGYTAYWFTGEGLANGRKVSTLRYALCENGGLYQIVSECLGDSPQSDRELLAILNSFKILSKAPTSSKSVAGEKSLAYRIGFITGNLLVVILIVGIVVKLVRKQFNAQKQPPRKST